jgi:hypothetical protein
MRMFMSRDPMDSIENERATRIRISTQFAVEAELTSNSLARDQVFGNRFSQSFAETSERDRNRWTIADDDYG